jgi:hypothetical protein
MVCSSKVEKLDELDETARLCAAAADEKQCIYPSWWNK